MALNPIPPQAYTKETLQKAYSWLLRQAPEIKEMARDQEILVSLYLKAQRNGEESLDRPSIHNFRSELKNLADMMIDLNADPNTGSARSTSKFQESNTFENKPKTTNENFNTHFKTIENSQNLNSNTNPLNQSKNENPHMLEKSTTINSFLNSSLNVNLSLGEFLDERSLLNIRATQQRFNLSTETEALRLLIAIGIEKLNS
jgi:hypothetical protein